MQNIAKQKVVIANDLLGWSYSSVLISYYGFISHTVVQFDSYFEIAFVFILFLLISVKCFVLLSFYYLLRLLVRHFLFSFSLSLVFWMIFYLISININVLIVLLNYNNLALLSTCIMSIAFVNVNCKQFFTVYGLAL